MTDAAELAALRAERDALAQQVDALRARGHHRIRSTVVGVLVVVSGLAVAVAPVAVWARAQVLEGDRWVAVAGPLADEPAIQAALADWATGQLVTLVEPERILRRALPGRADVLSVPLAGAVTSFIHGRAVTYLRSDEFARLWEAAVLRAHQAALRLLEGDAPALQSDGDQVTIDLVPLLQRVLDRVASASPEILGREVDIPEIDIEDVPPDAVERIADALGVEPREDLGQITVYDRGRLRALQDVLRRLGRLVTLVVLVALAGPVAAVALSRRRGRTAAAVAGVALFGLVLVRRGAALLSDEALSQVADPDGRAVADRLLDRLLDPLVLATAWMAGACVVIIVAHLVGPSVAARVDRRSLSRGAGALRSVAARHTLAAQGAAALVGLAVLWFGDLGWLASLLVVAATGVATVAVGSLGRGPSSPEATRAG